MSLSQEWSEFSKSVRDKPVVLVASTGGHLVQALKWADLLGVSSTSPIVTFDTPQSRPLVDKRDHIFVPYVAPRDFLRTLTTAFILLRQLRHSPARTVVSTGAAVGLAAYFFAIVTGRRFVFIESVSRVDGPSLTGTLLAKAPFVKLFAQYDRYPHRRWRSAPNLLASYAVHHVEPTNVHPLRVFVTLGTIRPYRFDRMVDAVKQALPTGSDVRWQLGSTARGDLPGLVLSELEPHEFEVEMRNADVIVTHAGVGTLMTALEMGKLPILFTRSSRLGEHVDDHQEEISVLLLARNVALDGASLTQGMFATAASAVVLASGADE